MNSDIAHTQQLHNALAKRLPLTFRHGSVVVKIHAVTYTGNMLTILSAEAWYNSQPVSLDLPLHYINARVHSHPLLDAETYIADTVRSIGANR